ncbi:TonB-dependent receptor family protein [Blastochloris viridis]|uniref:TonB-dependent receptor family protein n=1 Tax=Blastochloris viridis TaxID=1079 RepID=UPI0006D74A41|nr:TonB-dependent receptor [Blastochloris viridis]ALK08770.1 Vitamin B12 transporter BtuB [Blastochloris viridis]
MIIGNLVAGAASLVALLAASDAVRAQSAAPASTVTLDEVVIEGEPATEAEARRRLAATAGGTAVIDASQNIGKANVSIADTLNGVPGVVAVPFLGGNDQPKIHIRGSGLQSNPTERGLLMLQDGLPINRADGSYIVGLIDARQADVIEVFRGYTANRLGAQTLGGAINFISPTGSRAPGVEVGVEGGSFGHLVATARAGARQGDADIFGQISTSRRDGYRDWNDSERTAAAVNAGAKLSDNVSTRLFFGYTDLAFEVPGPLSRQLYELDPRQAAPGAIPGVNAGPNVLRDRPRRDTEQVRLGSRTTGTFGANTLDLAIGYAWTDDSFRFPIGTGYRDTTGGDTTVSLRYAYQPDTGAALPLFEATALYVVGASERNYFINDRSAKGALFGANDLDADTLSLNAGFNIPLAPTLTVSPAVTYAHASRDSTDTYAAARRPRLAYNGTSWLTPTVAATDTSFSRSYDAVSPSLGLTYQLAPNSLVFTALSRSFEAPTFDDLLEASGGGVNASPTGFLTPDLKAETATTLEAGWRGTAGRLGWDVVAYYSWLDNELIRTTDGNVAATINATDTTHFGVELGGTLKLTDRLSARLAYTYQDFRFDRDPLYGDNRIAGAPRHFIVAALRYAVTAPWWIEAEVQWTLDDVPVDNANTLYSDAFAVVNVRTNWAATPSFDIYGEVRNLFDADYIGATLTLGRAANAYQAAFLPGDGRAFYAGTKVRF